PELMEVPVNGQTVLGYPALEDQGETVSLRVFDSEDEAQKVHARGLLRLFMLQFREQVKYFDKTLPNLNTMAMQFMSLGSSEELKRQLIELTFARACLQGEWPRDAASFKTACADARNRLGLMLQEVCRLVGLVLAEWQTLQKKLPGFKVHAAAVQDIDAQLKRLLGKRFILDTPFERLQHYPRYLKAAQVRLDKLKADPARDSRLQTEYAPLWQNYERRAQVLARQNVSDEQLEQFRWLLEELRVNLYAQELKTPVPVSVKRLQKMWEGMR
ncbi:MAG: hypothetical protein RIR00_2670, partial [Pseudomonadota bacterium]